MHGKNHFAKVSKILAKYRFKNNMLDYQNNYAQNNNNAAESVDIL